MQPRPARVYLRVCLERRTNVSTFQYAWVDRLDRKKEMPGEEAGTPGDQRAGARRRNSASSEWDVREFTGRRFFFSTAKRTVKTTRSRKAEISMGTFA